MLPTAVKLNARDPARPHPHRLAFVFSGATERTALGEQLPPGEAREVAQNSLTQNIL